MKICLRCKKTYKTAFRDFTQLHEGRPICKCPHCLRRERECGIDFFEVFVGKINEKEHKELNTVRGTASIGILFWIIIILLLLNLLAPFGGAADKWTKPQKEWWAMYTLGSTGDWLQTRQIAKNPDKYYERNTYTLGRHPSVGKVNIVSAVMYGVNLGIAHILPSRCVALCSDTNILLKPLKWILKNPRNSFLKAVTTFKWGVVADNYYRAGLEFKY